MILPYLKYPHYTVKQEIMNLILYSLLTNKPSNIDLVQLIRDFCSLITDKNLKVRFLALEALAYMSKIEDTSNIIIIANNEIGQRNVVQVIRKRIDMGSKIKINADKDIEYPSLCKLKFLTV